MTQSAWSSLCDAWSKQSQQGYGALYATTALQGIARDTLEGYRGEVRKYAARIRRQPGASTRESLHDQTVHLVQSTSSDASIKKLISGVCILEKLR